MNNKFIERVIKDQFIIKEIPKDNNLYDYYIKIKNYPIPFIDYSTFVDYINYSKLKDVYIDLMNNVNKELIINSDIHGLGHVYRTSLYVLVIASIEKISVSDFKLLLESILYHDIGRINDIDDDEHGFNAVKKLSFLKDKYREEEYNLICFMIASHCLDDSVADKIIDIYHIKEVDKAKKLLFILKDADALDRVREYPYCDINYLRYNFSKTLLLLACDLFNSYGG